MLLRALYGPTFTQRKDPAGRFHVAVNAYGPASGFNERTNHSPCDCVVASNGRLHVWVVHGGTAYLRISLTVPFRSGAPCRALPGSPPAAAQDSLTCCLTASCTWGLRPSSNRPNCRGTAVWETGGGSIRLGDRSHLGGKRRKEVYRPSVCSRRFISLFLLPRLQAHALFFSSSHYSSLEGDWRIA